MAHLVRRARMAKEREAAAEAARARNRPEAEAIETGTARPEDPLRQNPLELGRIDRVERVADDVADLADPADVGDMKAAVERRTHANAGLDDPRAKRLRVR